MTLKGLNHNSFPIFPGSADQMWSEENNESKTGSIIESKKLVTELNTTNFGV